MRGTVLVLDSDRSVLVDVDLLRTNGLMVRRCAEPSKAFEQLARLSPDVVVVVTSQHDMTPVARLRGLADSATSIIVASVPSEREAARQAGADFFLPAQSPPTELLYEIHRALILRRSGRRLSWNA